MSRVRVCAICLILFLAAPARAADSISVAVASNFTRSAAELAEQFEAETGIAARLSSGSTGKLYTQILNGAPFDVFLAADADRPMRLEQSGHTVDGARATYAIGALVLWSRSAQDCRAALSDEHSGRIALANPATAPYGKAAVEYLTRAGYWDSVSTRAVYGENINQTLQFVATGNAVLGLIAKSQLGARQLPEAACVWEVPASPHANLKQQAVLLLRAADKDGARRFYDFLSSDAARKIIERHGYEVPR
jgi:molybdate transport system substrate-binding protein